MKSKSTMNGGGSWSFVTLPEHLKGFLLQTSCSGRGKKTICTAVGIQEENDINFPLLLQSTDGAKSWEIVTIPGLVRGGEFHTTYCTGSGKKAICLAAGFLGPRNLNKPILVQSINGGRDWKIVSIAEEPQFGIFVGTSCTDTKRAETLCIASGFEGTIIGSGEKHPLLAQSTDGGHNWAVVKFLVPATGIFQGAASSSLKLSLSKKFGLENKLEQQLISY